MTSWSHGWTLASFWRGVGVHGVVGAVSVEITSERLGGSPSDLKPHIIPRKSSGASITVPSAPLGHVRKAPSKNKQKAYEGQRAYGKDAGPWRAGIGRGGELAHEVQS
jgi:hypothetical protein